MNNTITFQNGDKIILNPKGNTYIGELAHLAMSTYYKMVRDNKLNDTRALQEAFYKEVIKQKITI